MTDEQLQEQIRAAADGNGDALQQLIVHYHVPLREAVVLRLDQATRRYFEPEDVLQDTYISAFKSVGSCRFEGPDAFFSWLLTIAVNRLRDLQRRLRRQKRDVHREVHGVSGRQTSLLELTRLHTTAATTPSRHVQRDEVVAAVVSSLARLTDDQRAVVQLRFLEGRSVAEIADTLGKTEAAIHMLCHRGLKMLDTLMVSITRYLTPR